MLAEALESVSLQTTGPAMLTVAYDVDHEGAWATRNRAGRMSASTWTAFLDDDDLLDPDHLAHLLWCAEEQGADLVSSWFRVSGGHDPFPQHRGLAWDPEIVRIFPITYMVRTELLHAAMDLMGGFQADPDGTGNWGVQDYPLLRTMLVGLGGKHYASPEVTWTWRHHGSNSSGVPSRVRWDAGR